MASLLTGIRCNAIRRRRRLLLLLPISPLIFSSLCTLACISLTLYKLSYKGKQKLWGNLTICHWIHAIVTGVFATLRHFGAASTMRLVAWMLIHGRAAALGAGNRRLVLSGVASVPW
ncbi:hypothetical protein DAI22_06g233600 [Oryza sativa Japonica Group]|jgi:hypothetical protein|nr:hypothetical protein DAI22_06g233600 [Oryza sativa Japonica Group]